jgi:23S rRNA (uracil1939-C5)-methyltransferase
LRVPPAPPIDTPQCRHFGVCGGCSHLDVPINEQLHDKVRNLEALLRPLLGEIRLQYTEPQHTPVHFRTKLLYPVRQDHEGKATLGIYEPQSHVLVRVRECRTQDESLTALGVSAEHWLRALGLMPWNETTGKGFIRAFHARLCAGTGELLMGVVTRPGMFSQGKELAERLMTAAQSLPSAAERRITPVGVVRSISDRDGNFLLGDRNVPLIGRDYQEDRVDGLTFRLHFGSFYQIHRHSSTVLYKPALQMAGDVRGQRVVDGYGGVGTFGLRLAKAFAARVEIIEDNSIACVDALHNAKANGLPQVTVIEAKFAQAEFAPEMDLLLVDPPRSGLQADGVLRVIAAKPKRLLCVHCSADSLARDLEGLLAAGFKVAGMRLCDMFPHTDHVEVVTMLERRT